MCFVHLLGIPGFFFTRGSGAFFNLVVNIVFFLPTWGFVCTVNSIETTHRGQHCNIICVSLSLCWTGNQTLFCDAGRESVSLLRNTVPAAEAYGSILCTLAGAYGQL